MINYKQDIINKINNMRTFSILYKSYKPSSSTKQFSAKLNKKVKF